MKDLITQTEAAELRGASLRSINNLIRRGKLRSVEHFGKNLVYRSEVLAYEPSQGGRRPKRGGEKRATGQIRAANGISTGKKKDSKK